MVHYFFETDWVIEAPIGAVFGALTDADDLLSWWPSVNRARLVDRGNERGEGARASYTVQSPLLYQVQFDLISTEVDPPRRIRGLAEGDLVGTGESTLEEAGGMTTIHFRWYVSTAKRWMNVLTPVAKPFFAWAHGRVMRQGLAALARHLDARAISVTTSLVDQPTPLPSRD